MTLSLNTNMAASKAAIHLANNTENLNKSLDRLSSGKRITSAADDAGGLAVAMKMESSINTLKATSNNIGNGISFLQAREGVLDQMGQVVSRISELVAQTDNLLLTDNTEIDATLGAEYVELSAQLTSLLAETFNGVEFFGATGTSDHDIYSRGGATVALDVMDPGVNAGAIDVVVGTPTAAELRALTADQATAAIDAVAGFRAANAGELSTLQFTQETLENEVIGLTESLGRIVDVDIAAESANLAKQQILVQASASMVAQANSANNAILQLLQ